MLEFLHNILGGIDLPAQSSQQDIIFTCLMKIIVCDYVAVHPNIPESIKPGVSRVQRTAHSIRTFTRTRLVPLIIALVFPEWILAWAIRQRIMARQVAKQNGLSNVQGFFIIMGGFHLYRRSKEEKGDQLETGGEDEPLHPLDHFDVTWLINNGKERIDLPSEKDMKKSLWIGRLVKSLVSVYTLWFATHSILRWKEGIRLSELEAMTLAYLFIYAALCYVLWDKPYTFTPVRVYGELPDRCPEQQNILKFVQNKPVGYRFVEILGFADLLADLRNEKGIPPFYTGCSRDLSVEGTAWVFAMLIAHVFGLCHHLGPSTDPWKRVAFLLAFLPTNKVICLFGSGIALLSSKKYAKGWRYWLARAFQLVLGLLLIYAVVAYIVARGVTFVLTFKSVAHE